jgi:formylglycine-generating enzyme required for sulfatase activity
MAGSMGILARGALAGLLSLGALAGCDPVKSLLQNNKPLSIAQTVTVTVEGGHRLRVGISEVTWQDWKRCHDAGGCSFLPRSPRRNDARPFPAVGVNRLDVDEFVAWVNSRGDVQYRLPSAAEWTLFAAELPKPVSKKLFDDPRLAWAADYGQAESVPARVEPSGSFGALPNGIQDLGGNVWEWTATCAVGDADDERCPAYFAMGLHQATIAIFIRDPVTGGCTAGAPPANVGFRLVSDIEDLES